MLYEPLPSAWGGERGSWTGWQVLAAAIILGGFGLLLLTSRTALDPQVIGQLRAAGLHWAQGRIQEVGQVGHYLLQCNLRWLQGWRWTH